MALKTLTKAVLIAALSSAAAPVLAVTETVITVTPLPGGGEQTSVTKQERAPEAPDLSFEWADRNHNSRIERQEAKDMGILTGTFNRHAGAKGYLTREEYEQAIQE